MKRKIVSIDREKCTGCGACAAACHEGAIEMRDGRAVLVRDDYCDGLGDCLPACPAGAIAIEEREAAAYDSEAVKARQRQAAASLCELPGLLSHWPVQLKLAPVRAPWLDGADLLVAADCTAYACVSFHERFIRGRATLIGCPKLDGVNYAEKLGEILCGNDIRSILVVRMEVPCCGGLTFAVKTALESSGKDIPLEVVTLSIDGKLLGRP